MDIYDKHVDAPLIVELTNNEAMDLRNELGALDTGNGILYQLFDQLDDFLNGRF